MKTKPKKLQNMREADVGTLEWSTWSEVHVTKNQELNIDNLGSLQSDNNDLVESLNAIGSLQNFSLTEDVTTMEWSTTSRVHVTKQDN